jgi:hypothetical protein
LSRPFDKSFQNCLDIGGTNSLRVRGWLNFRDDRKLLFDFLRGYQIDMTKAAAIIQIILVLLVVGISTYYFFRGNFEVGLAFLPLLMIYYVFVTARRKRGIPEEKE